MKTYVGKKNTGEHAWPGSVVVLEVPENGPEHGEERRYDLEHHVRHSPDGFSWGYGGSGPAELARCILLDHFDIPAMSGREFDAIVPGTMYRKFLDAFVARWGARWAISTDEITKWLDENGFGEARDTESVKFGGAPHRQAALAEARVDIEEARDALQVLTHRYPEIRALVATILRGMDNLANAIEGRRNDGLTDEEIRQDAEAENLAGASDARQSEEARDAHLEGKDEGQA